MDASDKVSKGSSVAARLFAIIMDMGKDEQQALLKELEERVSKGKRKDARKPFFMVVDYATEDRTYQDFIQNISAGGVFIQTRIPLSVGQYVSLTFPLPRRREHIKIEGEVVRTTSEGIGIRFKTTTKDQEALIRSLVEMI